MRNDLLTQALYQEEFVQFAIKYNKFVTHRTEKGKLKYNDHLWLVLENIIKYEEKSAAVKYIYMREDYTNILLDTLKNYQSKDLLLHIIKTKISASMTYRIWLIQLCENTEEFTSLFSYNYLHGLPSFEQIGRDQAIILDKWKNCEYKGCLWLSYEINKTDGCIHVVIQVWEKQKENNKLFFTVKETIYKQKLPIQATFEYLNYKYLQKNLFDIFEVSFDALMANHK
jgi:hypothetical protein